MPGNSPRKTGGIESADEYTAAVDDMLTYRSHLAPWTVVSGEQKRWANQVVENVVARMEKALASFEHPDWGEDGYMSIDL